MVIIFYVVSHINEAARLRRDHAVFYTEVTAYIEKMSWSELTNLHNITYSLWFAPIILFVCSVHSDLSSTCLVLTINRFVSTVEVCCLLVVAVLWGATNPFLKKGTEGIERVKKGNIILQFLAEVKFLFLNFNVS